MPEITKRLGLKKPLGNETVSRIAYNENLDILDNRVATVEELKTVKSQMADTMKLGTTNQVVNKVKAVELKVDTRIKALTYINGNLNKVEEKDGTSVIKTTSLNYDGNGTLTSVTENAGGTSVTTTLNYDSISGSLLSVMKAVS